MSELPIKFNSQDLQMVQDMLAKASSDSQIRDVLVGQGYIEPDADELIQYAREQLAATSAPALAAIIHSNVEMNPRDIALVKDMRASSIPDYKIRDALMQRGYTMDGAIQLMKSASGIPSNSFEKFKRKRGNQPYPYYPPASSGSGDGSSKVALGLLIAGIGCAITFFTYSSASSSSSGGTYIIAYGPIIYGGFLILKGLIGKD